MKKLILILPLIAMAIVGCKRSDSENALYEENWRLLDSISVLNKRIAELESNNSANNNSANNSSDYTIETNNNTVSYSDFVGEYVFTDEDGNKYKITINPDETGVLEYGNGQIEYGSVTSEVNSRQQVILNVPFETQCKLKVKFTEGYVDLFDPTIKDGWVYAKRSYANANHPKWRLKATKIK